ncbi:MAG TPA: DUF1501 domain-containing protein [Tepidisphaeraceae bacterium]|jgi:hypothetical protein|nr:DUF1501 domain-containing protein [Tepidisphaeraceae bacterium]
MQYPNDALKGVTRRHFFKQAGFGIGAAALASMLNENLFAGNVDVAAADPLAIRPPHFAPTAKSVIFLFMAGGPSQLELFDYKPKLVEYSGQLCPEELIKNERFAFIKGRPKLLGTSRTFARHGQSGQEISDLLPHLSSIADDVAIVRSLHTTQFNHAPAQIFMNTGFQLMGRPSMGSWLTYGLGSENKNLPGFVVLISGDSHPDGGKSCWSAGFLPTVYQGAEFRNSGEPVLFLNNPAGMSEAERRRSLDTLRAMNQMQLDDVGDPEISTRINAYEMAYRMQFSVPDLTDIAKEPPAIHEMYGTKPGKPSFANNCLLARRLVERGVRFVQLYHRGWDNHGTNPGDSLTQKLPSLCRDVDQAGAALVKDLKQRGLLDETLVIWGGEFGRTPMNEARGGSKFLGRDHHPHCFSMWMAGGGIKPGSSYGKTDELGYNLVENAVDVHDLHATVLRMMGMDHKKLTYRFQGRDFRLTDVSGNVITPLLA